MGVETLNGPCGIPLPLSRTSQLPYTEKLKIVDGLLL